jgi:hypothetical protein
MARGFESKDVEFQQAERERGRTLRPVVTAAEQQANERRTTLLLSLARARGDLESARSFAHRRMLEQAISALEAELAAIPD